MLWLWVNLEGRHSDCWYWRIRKLGCTRNLSQKTECKRSPDNPQRQRICTSCGRWYSIIVRRRLRIPRTHSEAGTDREEWRSQWRTSRWTGRVSTDRVNRWRWSPWRLLVDSRRLHLSSSQWTSSSTLRFEGRNIPYPTEIHWCDKVNLHWSGRHANEKCWWLLECRLKQKSIRLVERFTKFTLLKEKPPKRICVVQGEIDKSSNDYQTRSCVARSMDKTL